MLATAPVAAGSPTTIEPTATPAQVLPGPWEAVQEIIEGVVESLADGVSDLREETASGFIEGATEDSVDEFTRLEVTLPAPGDPLQPSTWVTAHEDHAWYNAMWQLYWGLVALLAVPTAALGIYHYANSGAVGGDPAHRKNRVRETAKVFVLFIAGWILAALYVHSMNTIAMGLAPAGAEFMATPSDISRLGVGIVLGAALLILYTGTVLAGIIILAIQWVLMAFLFATLPGTLFGRASGIPEARAVGDQAVAAFVALPIIKVGQAALLRFMFVLPLDFADPGQSAATLIVTGVGLWLVYYKVPVKGLQRAIPEAGITTSGRIESIGGRGARQRRQAARQHASAATTRVKEGTTSAARRVVPSRRSSESSSDSSSSSSSETTTTTSSETTRNSKTETTSSDGSSNGRKSKTGYAGSKNSDHSITQRIRNYQRSKTKHN